MRIARVDPDIGAGGNMVAAEFEIPEGAARDGGEVASIKGAISNIVADKSFDVDFTGSRSFTQRYGRFGQRYQRLDADPTQTMPDC